MKKRTIFDIFLIFVLLGVLIYLGKIDYSKETEGKDSKRFDKDYSLVSNDNNYKYIGEEELYEKMQKEDIIVFMGFKENEWCNYYAKILNEVASEMNIEEIYYYDFLVDRQKKSVIYDKIVKFLEIYLQRDDMGNVNIVAPSLLVMKDGNVLFYDSETSITSAIMTPKEYWTEENVEYKKNSLRNVFNNYLGTESVDGGSDAGEN